MKQTSVKNRLVRRLVIVVLFSFSVLVQGRVHATELLNSSYDISRELFTALNLGFQQQWEQQNPGDELTIKQSHASSSKQALAVLQGLKADVVTYNQVTDVQILHDRGKLIPADWQSRLPNNSSPFYSTMAFLVRKDNPKKIHDWDDLVHEDVKLVFPNPKISGNGRYTYLAAWGATQQKNGGSEDKTRAWMLRLLNNVVVFDIGGRGATTTFIERGLGDVLISFESEVNNILEEYGRDHYEVIVPPVDILAEFPVAWIDKNIEKQGTEKVAKEYLTYLYSPQAQKIITEFNYRTYNDHGYELATTRFPVTQLLKVEDLFGGWPQVMATHFSTDGVLDQLLAQRHQ